MSSIRVRTGPRGTRYAALWTGPDGVQHSETFSNRKAAKDFLAGKGGYAHLRSKGAPYEKRPATIAAEGTVLDYARVWVQTHPLTPATRETYGLVIEKHIARGIGGRTPAQVTSADVYKRFETMRSAGLSPSLLAKIRAVTSSMFETAVAKGQVPGQPGARAQEARRAAAGARDADLGPGRVRPAAGRVPR